MYSSYSLGIQQEDDSVLMHLSSKIPHPLLHIDLQVRCVSSLNEDITLNTFNRSITGRRDVFLSEENGRNIIHSLAADSGPSQEFVDTKIVPFIFCYVQNVECWPRNRGRQVIVLRVKICIAMNPVDEIGDLVDESMANSVRFKPASKSSIEALERVHWIDNDEDEDEQNLLLKKKGKLGSGSSSSSSSEKGCTVCLDEFSDGAEVTSMPCVRPLQFQLTADCPDDRQSRNIVRLCSTTSKQKNNERTKATSSSESLPRFSEEVDWQDQRQFKFKSLSLPARGVVVDGMDGTDESYMDRQRKPGHEAEQTRMS
ncbi:hypothetical protein GQ457_17G023970 [Hibiscus cannabinus]